MAQRTLIGGTGYDITKGRTLIGGTGYDVTKGRTLIGGTGYDVGLRQELFTVALSGSFDENWGYAIIDGVKYTNSCDVEAESGTIVTVYIDGPNATYQKKCTVSVNGTVVKSGSGSYEFNLTCDCAIKFIRTDVTISGSSWSDPSSYSKYFKCQITR